MTDNRLMGLIFAMLTAALFVTSFQYPAESTIYVRFILVIFFILSIVLLFTKSKSTQRLRDMFTTKRMISAGIILLYIIAIPIIGFFVSTFAFAILFMVAQNRMGILKYCITSAVFTGIVYGVFQVLLGIWFPTGLLI